ncbi:MAG: VCBS repeat-containing protein [Lachnospiraceae bacterium]|nr:VCBS repeat-containing protein [Lachnospiraceae bacterium]
MKKIKCRFMVAIVLAVIIIMEVIPGVARANGVGWSFTALAAGVSTIRSPLEVDYEDYRRRFEGIERRGEIEVAGFGIIDDQVFEFWFAHFGDVWVVPAFENHMRRLAIFLTDKDGQVLYKTDQLETNNRSLDRLRQPTRTIAAISFQDMNRDGLDDIGLITTCMLESGDHVGQTYKVGDILFQSADGFYRDYRISDKINRFGMNKSVEMMRAFVRDGYSTEFLYTATTLDELLRNGLVIADEQHYTRQFEKLGRLEVVPGSYAIANYEIFMIYLVNERGEIVWSLQPMGEYDNLYALKGMAWRDIDGDGVRDIAVLARYSYEDSQGEMVIESDYAIYYQQTGGFVTDTEFKETYQCAEEETMEELIRKAREYWGWTGQMGEG